MQIPNSLICIFEKNSKVGKKILATGNGKCNLSNDNLESGLYNSSFAYEIIRKFGVNEVKNAFKRLGLLTKTDKEGRIYPYSLSANSVLDALYNGNISLGNKIICDYQVNDIKYDNNCFLIDGKPFDYCIMACGGKASVAYSHLIGEKLVDLGHKWVADHPGLCAIKTKEATSSLNGIKVKARVSVDDHKFDGEVLFKDHGLSGIAIFEVSRYLESGKTIHLDLMSDYSIEKLKEMIDNVSTFNYSFPKMIAKDLMNRVSGDLNLALSIVKDYKFTFDGYASYQNAQIMVGGIDTNDVNQDCESKIIPNLYIIGEVLNVDGTCGGYNLHFAWASAYAACEAIAKALK